MKEFKYGKILLFLTLALVTANITYYVSPARSQQGAYFSDEFNMGAYDWTTVNGSWAVVNGQYTEMTKPDTDSTWAAAGSLSWTDYSVQAKVYSPDTQGKFFLAGRWQNENNHYALEYSSDETGAAGADSATYKLYCMRNGIRYDLLTMTRASDPKVPYIGEGAAGVADNPYPAVLKLKFKGSNIEVYANDQLIGFTADTSVNYGKIAIGEFNRQVYFDEIYVWDVTPPTVFILSESEIAGTAATVSFATSEAVSWRIDYGPTTSYGSFRVQTARETFHEIDLLGLSLNTQYHYKITATDAAGNQTVTDDRVFTTAAALDTVAPSVYDISAEDVEANEATICWTSDEPSNSIVDYGLQSGVYKWSLSYDTRTVNHAVYLKKLQGLTTYYYRVKSRDLTGNLAVSGEYSFTTLKDMKPKITAVKTGSTPTVNLSVYWRDVPTAVSYKVYVSTSNDWGTPVTIADDAQKTEYSFNKSGLTAYTNYFVRVYAIDGSGVTDYASARAFPPGMNPHGNPHGFYESNSELCDSCHYTHSALGPQLISEVNADRLCITCHDGTQSKYDVVNGRFVGPTTALYTNTVTGQVYGDVYRADWYSSIAGPYGTIGGRTVASSVYTPTSRHDLNIYNYAAPGNNIENIEIADANLSCATCHDPHGSDNYRNLKTNMRVLNDDNPPLINMEAYAITDAANKRENTTYVSGAVEFCGACHSDFNQSAGASRNAISTTDQPGMTLSNASTHMYMHPVNVVASYHTKTGVTIPTPTYLPLENGNIICQTCHFTHGTTNTGEHYRRDGFYSTCLKRFDKNTGCEDCHNKTDYPD